MRVGGWLTTNASWHWAFLINVPIAIAVVIGVLLLVPETRDITDTRGIDPYGMVLGTLGLGALVFGLIEGQNYGWFTPKREFTVGGFTWPSDVISAPGVALILSVVLLAHVRPRRDPPQAGRQGRDDGRRTVPDPHVRQRQRRRHAGQPR